MSDFWSPSVRSLPLRILVVLGALLALSADRADSFYLFESGHVRPLALSPSGRLLFAVNTPDNRLEIFQVTEDALTHRGEVVVGLEPVAVAARTDGELYVVNHLSDSVSVVDATDPSRPHVKATWLVGDEPRDIVVGGARHERVFVTTARRGQNRPGKPDYDRPGIGRADVWILDAVDIHAPPHIVTLFCDTPRALAVSPDGSRVYAAAFHSGNQTTVLNELAVDPAWSELIGDGFTVPGPAPPLENDAGVPAPRTGLIVKFDGERWLDGAGRDWTPRVRFNLPDRDVFIIDAVRNPPVEIGHVSGVGTTLFNMAVHPVDGRLFVSNLESRNHVRFKPALRGHVVENRVTIIRGTRVRPIHLNPHIDYHQPDSTRAKKEKSLALPLGLQFSADGRTLYLCAFGSGKVGVLRADGQIVDWIEVGAGPSGLVLDERRGNLYVMNRFDHTISIVDLKSRRELCAVGLRYNPEPPFVRAGRPFLYDARRSSGHGDAACGSCHLFGDLDHLAWNLGDPSGEVRENHLVRNPSDTGGKRIPFHPLRGPMLTMTLRGLPGTGPMHWRGDANGGPDRPFDESIAFMHQRPAFQTLLGRKSEFPLEDMKKLRQFALALRYPPNPMANIDGSLTPLQAAGKEIFYSDGNPNKLGGSGTPCTGCHVLPLGTAGHSVRGTHQEFKVPHLRGLYQRIGMFGYGLPGIVRLFPWKTEDRPTPHLGDQVRGFGFTCDGSVPTLHDFLDRPIGQFAFKDDPGRSGLQKMRELAEYLLVFPTGLPPVVGHQVTLGRHSTEKDFERFRVFSARAGAGDGDLVVHGLFNRETGGWLYIPGQNERFQSNRRSKRITLRELLRAAKAGSAVLTATVVPPGSGRRIAIDRDEDGALDGDEIDRGTDPANPHSRPGQPAALRRR